METILGMSPPLALGIVIAMLLVGILLVDRRPPTPTMYILVDREYDRRSSGWVPFMVAVSLFVLLLYSMG